MNIEIYEYEHPIAISAGDLAPPSSRERKVWIFNLSDAPDGIEIWLRRVRWEYRLTAEHKWSLDRGWYRNNNDITLDRVGSQQIVSERPVPSSYIVEAAIDRVQLNIKFVPD